MSTICVGRWEVCSNFSNAPSITFVTCKVCRRVAFNCHLKHPRGSSNDPRTREDPISLRRLERRRAPRAELLDERRLLGLGGGQMPRLDVAEAADFLRDAGEAHSQMMVPGRQRG